MSASPAPSGCALSLIATPLRLPRRSLNAFSSDRKLEVILAGDLRLALDGYVGVPGAKRLRTLLDRDTFALTEEELERLFLRSQARGDPCRRSALGPGRLCRRPRRQAAAHSP